MRILLIDTAHQALVSALEHAGFECVPGYTLSRTEVLEIIKDYEGLIIRSRIQLDKEFIDCASRLKFIGRVGSGMESIDVKYAESKGIICLSSPEGNRDAVGEHAIGMLLALFNNLLRTDREVKEGKWIREANRGVELAGKIVGLIGYGNMGSGMAKKLSGFDCTVIAYDKYKKDFSDEFATEVTMEEIFKKTDILSLHIPLTGETEFLVNDEYIARFNKNIYIINTARGKCVKMLDLIKNIKSGKVLGACLDTIEYEESSFESILNIQNALAGFQEVADRLILSPHIAGWTKESSEKLAKVLAEKIIAKFKHYA